MRSIRGLRQSAHYGARSRIHFRTQYLRQTTPAYRLLTAICRGRTSPILELVFELNALFAAYDRTSKTNAVLNGVASESGVTLGQTNLVGEV
jgi:hypothetical protein